MSKGLLGTHRHKKEVYRGWKQGWITWDENRNNVRASRNQVRKAKVQIKLNLGRDVKDKKGFYKHIGDKKKTKENVSPLLNKTGQLVTQDIEKAKVVSDVFVSVFTSKTSLQESQIPDTRGKGWSEEDVPLLEEDPVGEYLSKLDIHTYIHGL